MQHQASVIRSGRGKVLILDPSEWIVPCVSGPGGRVLYKQIINDTDVLAGSFPCSYFMCPIHPSYSQ